MEEECVGSEGLRRSRRGAQGCTGGRRILFFPHRQHVAELRVQRPGKGAPSGFDVALIGMIKRKQLNKLPRLRCHGTRGAHTSQSPPTSAAIS